MNGEPTIDEVKAYLSGSGSPSPSASPDAEPTQDEVKAYLGDSGDPAGTPATPHTDKSLWDTIYAFAKKPSPQWLQPMEKFLTGFKLTPEELNPFIWHGRAVQAAAPYIAGGGLEKVVGALGGAEVGLGKAISGASTPANVGLALAAPYVPPAADYLISGVFLGQAIKGTPEQWRRLKAAPTWNEKAEIATQMVAGYAPAAGFPFLRKLFGKGAAEAEPEAQPEGKVVRTPEVEQKLRDLFEQAALRKISPYEYERRAREIEPETVREPVPTPEEDVFSTKDKNTQAMLSSTGGIFTEDTLHKHFPDHDTDELLAMGVIDGTPDGNYFVNPPGTKPPAPAAPAPVSAAVSEGADDIPAEPETEAQTSERLTAEERLGNVQDRLGIYGMKPVDTTGMTAEEAAKVLEGQESALNPTARRKSLASGKTFQEIRIQNNLRDQWIDEQKRSKSEWIAGEEKPETGKPPGPIFDVTAEPGGGFRVRSSPYRESMEEVQPPGPRGAAPARPVLRERIVPGKEFFMDREGGELQPYASRKPSTTGVGVRSEGGEVGTKASLRQPGAAPETQTQKPVPAPERPVATETPPGTAEKTPDTGIAPRYVVRETKQGAVVRDLQKNQVVEKFETRDLHPTPDTLHDLIQKAQEHASNLEKQETETGKTPEPGLTPEQQAVYDQLPENGDWMRASKIKGDPDDVHEHLTNLHDKEMVDYLQRPTGDGNKIGVYWRRRKGPDIAGQGGDKPIGGGGAPIPKPPPKPPPGPGIEVGGPGVGPKPEPEPGTEGGVGGTPIGKPKGPPWQRIGTKPMRYQHRDEPNLRLVQNETKKGGYDVIDMRGAHPQVIDHFPDRRSAQDAYLHGKFIKAETPESAPGEIFTGANETISRTASTFDYSDISGFERAVKQIHGRDLTPEERKQFAPIVEQYKKARAESAKATNQAMAKVARHFQNVKNISMEDAVQQVKDALEEAVKPCG